MNARYQEGRGIIVYVPPLQTQFPVAYPGLFDEVDVIIPRTFILAVGIKRDTGLFFNTPGIERAIREKQLSNGTFAYVNVEIRLHPKEGRFIPSVTRENIHFTKEEYARVLGREVIQRLIGKKVNKEVGRIVSMAMQRYHQAQQQKTEAARKPTKEKDLKKSISREPKMVDANPRKKFSEKMARARRAMQLKAVKAWRAFAGRPRKGVRKK